jgi:HSP20 family protein
MLRDRDELTFLSLRGDVPLGRVFAPPTDVYATDREVVITIELPGVPEDTVTVETDGSAQLSIRGRRTGPRTGGTPGDEVDYFRLERSFGDFDCRVSLPARARAERRTLTWADGVLTVVVPREGESR